MELFQETPKAGVICNYGIADHFKTSHFVVDFIMPLTPENATGMSLLAGVLSRGCAQFPRMDLISRYLAKNYGASLSINAGKVGELEILSFAFTCLDNAYAIDHEDVRGAMIALFREMVFRPLLSGEGFWPEYVAQEQNNLEDKITGLFNDKRIYALERCRELMCADEPYGIHETGKKELIRTFDPVALYTFFQKVMAEAQIVLSYVGKERDRVLDALAAEFSPRSGGIPKTGVREKQGAPREIIDPMDLNQSKLNLGYRLGPAALADGAACRLFNVLYGGSANSKLFLNVRERLSLCYYCSSNIDRLKNVMFVTSGIEAAKYDEARGEIEAQLAQIASGAFTDEEMENARVYLLDSIRGFYDSEAALASLMLGGTLRGALKTPEQEMEEVSRVTREQLTAIAREAKLDTVYFLKGVHEEA